MTKEGRIGLGEESARTLMLRYGSLYLKDDGTCFFLEGVQVVCV